MKKHAVSPLVFAAILLCGILVPAFSPRPASADSASLFSTSRQVFQPGEAQVGIFRQNISWNSAALFASGGYVKADLIADFYFTDNTTRIEKMFIRNDHDDQSFDVASPGNQALGSSGEFRWDKFKVASIQELIAACIARRAGSSGDPYTIEFEAKIEIAAYGRSADTPGSTFAREFVTAVRKIPIRVECKEVLPPSETYAKVTPLEWLFECPEGFRLQGRQERTLLTSDPTFLFCVASGDHRTGTLPPTTP